MYPLLSIDLSKIEHNARTLVERCRHQGIKVIGVTKCCLGEPAIADAMRRGGVHGIGDSRLASLSRLAEANVSPLMMLRQPMKDEIKKTIRLADISLISEVDIAISLSREAVSAKKDHAVILMVEAGDLREGILPEEALELVAGIQNLSHLQFLGIGANVACLEGTPPSSKNLELLLSLSASIKDGLGIEVPVISGGNSSALKLLEKGKIPRGIDQIRVGEGILLGQDTLDYEPIAGLYQDAFLLAVEVIEERKKLLDNKVGAQRLQAVLALGRQDVADGELKPLVPGLKILKRSSDHLVVDLDNCRTRIRTGDIIEFVPSYFALLAAMTSPFVNKRFVS